jgi:peptide-methionine (S)-S-oxide reductase
VQVEYDQSVVSTEKILEVFFFIHDPTQLNRQGNDIGTQYRSAIFYHDTEQKTLAEKMIAELDASRKYSSKIVTEVTKLNKFYPAEGYHQDYFNQNPGQGYCQAVVRPKIDKFVKTYKELLR